MLAIGAETTRSTSSSQRREAGEIREWAPFAGDYENKGNTIVTHNFIAKQVRGVGMTEEAAISFQGDTFTATAKSPPGFPVGERSTTYTRVR